MKTSPLAPLALLAALAVSACDRGRPADAAAAAESPAPATAPAKPVAVALRDWPLPAPPGAAQPDLVRAPDGSLLLSWIERDGKQHQLKFARWRDDAWSTPRTIARGSDWFVNWADTPHITQTADGALWAHWLQKSAAAPYAYDVVLTRSGDDGATWSKPVHVNDDGTPTEHGFVSLWPASHDRLGIAWLDGRRTAGADAHGGHDDHAAATPAAMMTLRTARFDAGMQRHDERELDLSTCDCCQTDVAVSARGPVIAYRDRTPDEIRDIQVATLDGGFSPKRVHADNWKMPACPVNGPSLDARGDTVVVGWYTAAGDVPTLRLARSVDGGQRFAAPVDVDAGTHVLGRADVAIDSDAVWLLSTREDAGAQSVQLRRFAPTLEGAPQLVEVARLQGRGRGTGFPQLAPGPDGMHVVWTDLVEGQPRLAGARVSAAENDATDTGIARR
ncbi:sialidase family protein [Lysobacter korlensis]|uniref:Sialidase family protein n=1 Tax=Lysobacter korlensis TaxID=553636 RepID=A0ABV6RK32_9GAMM